MAGNQLVDRHCRSQTTRLAADAAGELLAQVHRDWSIGEDGLHIRRGFRFKNFYETIAFVNALAWVANREDHHPDLEVGYNRCLVKFSTHSVGGLSENDFICAGRVDALIDQTD